MRVNRKIPTQVATLNPAYKPAREPEGPGSETRSYPAEQDRAQGDGNARGPVVHAEDLEADGDHPVIERRLLEVGYAVEPRRNPVAGFEHIPGDGGLYGVNVIHQSRRADDPTKKNDGGKKDDD